MRIGILIISLRRCDDSFMFVMEIPITRNAVVFVNRRPESRHLLKAQYSIQILTHGAKAREIDKRLSPLLCSKLTLYDKTYDVT